MIEYRVTAEVGRSLRNLRGGVHEGNDPVTTILAAPGRTVARSLQLDATLAERAPR
jgi:hypothetical protein